MPGKANGGLIVLPRDFNPTRPVDLIIGTGYQFAVMSSPVVQNNFVGTIRVTF